MVPIHSPRPAGREAIGSGRRGAGRPRVADGHRLRDVHTACVACSKPVEPKRAEGCRRGRLWISLCRSPGGEGRRWPRRDSSLPPQCLLCSPRAPSQLGGGSVTLAPSGSLPL